jgi:hypothetical protein
MQPIGSAVQLLNSEIRSRQIIDTQVVNEFSVHLIKNGNNLEYQAITAERIFPRQHIQIFEGFSLGKMIAYLKRCKVFLNVDGGVNFLPNRKTWTIEAADAHLLQGSTGLIWNIFQHSTNESSFFDFQAVTIPSRRCHPETIALIEKIKRNSLDKDYIACLKNDFQFVRVLDKKDVQKECENIELEMQAARSEHVPPITTRILAAGGSLASGAGTLSLSWGTITSTCGVVSSFFGEGILGAGAAGYVGLTMGSLAFSAGVMIPLSATIVYALAMESAGNKKVEELNQNMLKLQKTLLIEIEPISEPSYIDPRIRVSKFTWAVTLMTGPQGNSRNHASIIIEGLANEFFEGTLEDREHFMHKSEFNPPIESGLYSKETYEDQLLEGVERTEIWMKSSEKVMKMLRTIFEEKLLNREKRLRGEKQPFSLLGDDSVIWKGPSCFTWAREKLTLLGISLGKSKVGFIATIPRAFTDPESEHRKKDVAIQI